MSIANESEAAVDGPGSWKATCRRRLVEPLRDLQGGGLTPEALNRALALGALLGCMPIPWGTSLLCLAAALLLRLNPLAVQVGNYAAWPLQLLFAYPYLRLGTAWFGAPFPTTVESGRLLHSLAATGGAVLGAWALTAPLLLPLLYAAGRLLITAIGSPKRRGAVKS